MAQKSLADQPEKLRKALHLYAVHGEVTAAAEAAGVARSTFEHRLKYAQNNPPPEPEFEVPDLPNELPSIDELLDRRKSEWHRVNKARTARKLIRINVKVDGPFGIAHFGDPHLDDPGTDIESLEKDVQTVQRTPALFGGNVGDNHNNWVGRLARLYAEQETTAREAWMLVEWLIQSIDWLYLIKGNHDVWSGPGDPLDWISKGPGILEPHGARIALMSPNGVETRINARHDFHGHSMWNEVHGPKKAAKMGWRDHILVCGHKHTSGFALDKCPASGLVSNIIRVAGYKVHDSYASQLGLPDQNIFPSCVTIIRPDEPEDSPRRVHFIPDLREGAEYLSWLRAR